MTINDSEVVADLGALYPRCEEALANSDLETVTFGRNCTCITQEFERASAARTIRGCIKIQRIQSPYGPCPLDRSQSSNRAGK